MVEIEPRFRMPDAPCPGYKRQWIACKQCGRVSYYDYVPYSLSNPVMTLPCGHGAALRFLDSIYKLTEAEAEGRLRARWAEAHPPKEHWVQVPIRMVEADWADLRIGQEIWYLLRGEAYGPFAVVDPAGKKLRNANGVEFPLRHSTVRPLVYADERIATAE